MKEIEILTNKEVVQSVYDDLLVLSNWFTKYGVEDPNTSQIYDHRDMIPMSYLLIDFDSVSEDKREETYKNELAKMQAAFDTLDPKTGRPYPEAIKPYLKLLYDQTAGVMNYDVDWNDKKEVMKFVRAITLIQTASTMFKKFPREYLEIFPDANERTKINAKVLRNQGLYNRAHEKLKNDYNIHLSTLNQLTLISYPTANNTRFLEYFDYTSAQAILNDSKDIVFDPSVDPILVDYFSGIPVVSEQFDIVEEQMAPYDTDMAGYDIWGAIEDVFKSSHTESFTVKEYHIKPEDHLIINGRPLAELINEKGWEFSDFRVVASDILRNALTDGKSRVELMKFNHDLDGNIKFDYYQLKLDLSKLNLKDESITNAKRDEYLNSPENLQQQKYLHMKFERNYMQRLTKNTVKSTLISNSLLKFNFPRVNAYEKLVESNPKRLSGATHDPMLESMMIANDSDRDLRIPTDFNAFEHFESQKVDVPSLVENINLYIDNLFVNEGRTAEKMVAAIRSAQMAAYKYMIVNPTPDTPDDKAAHDALKMMIDKPKKAFASIMTKELRKEISKAPSMKEYTNALMSEGKEMLHAARAEARAAEENYNRRVEELSKRLADAKNELVFEQDDKKSFDLIEEQRTLEEGLKALREAEIGRLEQAYANGKLPLDYFEQRRVDVEQGKHDRKVPFGADERPSFKQFKAENADALEGMSSSDIKFMYNKMMENARREENKFILNSIGNKPEPVAETSVSTTNKEQTEAPKREHIPVPDAMDKKIDTVSAKIDDPQPVISKEAELK